MQVKLKIIKGLLKVALKRERLLERHRLLETERERDRETERQRERERDFVLVTVTLWTGF